MPRVMQRSQLSKLAGPSNAIVSPGSAQSLFANAARRLPSGVSGGSSPFAGLTMRFVCRCGMLGSVRPAIIAPPTLPSRANCVLRSTRVRSASMRWAYSSSVSHFLFMSHGGAGAPTPPAGPPGGAAPGGSAAR